MLLNIRLDVGQGLPGPKRPVGAFRGFRHSFHVGALVFQVADLISRDRCSSSADRREDGSDKARKLLGMDDVGLVSFAASPTAP